jgi:hypothetical protein
MALAKANCLYPEIDRNIRFFGSDSESILQYLISINVPYEVFEHLDIKMPNVENTLSEAEVINLVNKHLISLGMQPTEISWEGVPNGYYFYPESEWASFLIPGDNDLYQKYIHLGYSRTASTIMSNQGDTWEPLKTIILNNIIIHGLHQDGLFYLENKNAS